MIDEKLEYIQSELDKVEKDIGFISTKVQAFKEYSTAKELIIYMNEYIINTLGLLDDATPKEKRLAKRYKHIINTALEKN